MRVADLLLARPDARCTEPDDVCCTDKAPLNAMLSAMPTPSVDSEIRSRISAFLTDISLLVKRSALESVLQSLGGDAAAVRPGPGRPTGSGKRGPGKRPKAGGRAGRRSTAGAEELSGALVAHVKANPGQRLEEIGRALRMDTAVLKAPAAKLVVAGGLRREGQKRGTRYFLGGGRRKAAKPKASKAARRSRKPARPARAKRAAGRNPRSRLHATGRALAAKPAGSEFPAAATA